jgi:salicylate hydroxylase
MSHGARGPVLVAGGGIGGLTAALALARAGWRSHVLERRAAWSEAGAGIQLSPNGVSVLERLQVAADLAPKAGVPREIVVRDAASARVLQRLPLGEWIRARHGAPYWQVHRRDLQAALLRRVSAEPLIRVSLGVEVVGFASAGGGVAARGADGSSHAGAALVGADGVFSAVRRQLPGGEAPRFSGRTAARAVVPVVGANSAGEPASVLGPAATGVWLAPGAHVVHYPVRAGREIALVVVRTEDWSGRGWSAPVAACELEAALARLAPALAHALGSGHDWHRWALFEAEPAERWSVDRVTLLGDAAHPTLPFLAQGGSLALEDAWVLARCLAGAKADADIPSALAAYERERLQRTRRVVAAARRNGRIFHLRGAAALARNAAMRLLGGERVMAGHDWVYGWKPDAGDGAI